MSDHTEACLRTTLIGISFNAFLAAVKAITGILGNSYALIADAIESTSDIAVSLIVFAGLKIASIPPDDCHRYGHGKAEPLAAMVVSGALLTAATAIIIQSIREIMSPQYSPAPYTLIVLVLVVVIKESMYRYTSRVGNEAGSTAVKSYAWDNRSDAITSAGAFIGITIALIGGEEYAAADDWAALAASGIIIFNAIRLFRPALAEVMDAAPEAAVEDGIRKTALDVEGVTGLDVCNVRKMGLNFFVDLHVLVDGDLPVRRGHGIAHDVKDAVMHSDRRILDLLIHIEPSENSAVNRKETKPCANSSE